VRDTPHDIFGYIQLETWSPKQGKYILYFPEAEEEPEFLNDLDDEAEAAEDAEYWADVAAERQMEARNEARLEAMEYREP